MARPQPLHRGSAALALAALVGALLLAGCSSSSGGSPQAAPPAAQTVPSTTATSASPTSATSTKSPTTSASPSQKPFQTTTTAHTAPWTSKAADFGYVVKAVATTGGGATITFDRATWLTAEMVPAWNTAHPTAKVTAEDDYAIVNQSSELRTFYVQPGAVLFGSIVLAGQSEPKRITVAQLVSGVTGTPKPGVTCWLFHEYGGLTGDVVQLEEQFRP